MKYILSLIILIVIPFSLSLKEIPKTKTIKNKTYNIIKKRWIMSRKLTVLLGTIVLAFVMSSSAFARSNSNDILGTWLTAAKDVRITIYKKGKRFNGKIVWTTNHDDLDENNPDPKKRSRRLWGLNILYGLKFNESQWVGGKMYDPKNGQTYSVKFWLQGKNILFCKGYVGVALLGRKERWARVK